MERRAYPNDRLHQTLLNFLLYLVIFLAINFNSVSKILELCLMCYSYCIKVYSLDLKMIFVCYKLEILLL